LFNEDRDTDVIPRSPGASRLAKHLSSQSIRLGSSSLSKLKSPTPFVKTLNDAEEEAIEILSYEGSLDKTTVLQNLKTAGFDSEQLESKMTLEQVDASLNTNELTHEPLPTPTTAGATLLQVVTLAISFGASLAMLFIVSAALYT
jgi:hypothetical protein